MHYGRDYDPRSRDTAVTLTIVATFTSTVYTQSVRNTMAIIKENLVAVRSA